MGDIIIDERMDTPARYRKAFAETQKTLVDALVILDDYRIQLAEKDAEIERLQAEAEHLRRLLDV